MPVSFIIFIVIHLLALAYFLELFRRISRRHHEYPLEENKNTVPFGIVKLRYVVIFYIATYTTWVIFSFWLYAFFVGGWDNGGSTAFDL